MKCVCTTKCQVRIGDKSLMFKPGMVSDFEKCPTHFEELEARELDFATASEQELAEAKWKFEEAYEAVKHLYNIELTKEEGTKKSDVIAQILDARFRSLSEADLNRVG